MEIQTPRGKILMNEKNMKAELFWSPGFEEELNRQYALGSPLQKFVDNMILSDMQPYIPLLTSALIQSGILGTNIGEGVLRWIAIYARMQYYRGRLPGESQTGALRGRLWAERAKLDKIDQWTRSAQAFIRKGRE